jgi:precorrin-6y C5,15-methyltransferase (decarboxylating) CbiE subunit
MIRIVGCGPGARRCVTLEALEAIAGAEVLIGAPRLLELFPEAKGERIAVRGSIAEVEAAISVHADRRIAILVAGDPGIASLARLVLRRFGREVCCVIPGVSSVQTAFARLGADWTGARILSAHASVPEIPYSALEDETAIAVLLGSPGAGDWVAGLAGHLGAGWTLFLAENLTLPGETAGAIAPEALRGLTGNASRIAILLRSGR